MSDLLQCSKCKQDLTLDCFWRRKDRKRGFSSQCKNCKQGVTLAWRKQHENEVRKRNTEYHQFIRAEGRGVHYAKRIAAERRSRLSKFGLTIETFNLLRIAQNNCCAICKSAFPENPFPHVDHDHKTGEVRGLLCAHCNRGLGYFRDSSTTLRAAAEYIEFRRKIT